MRLELRSPDFPLTDALREHAEKNARAALGRVGHRVSSLLVRLRDENGPRGGDDKRVQVVGQVRTGGTFVVEARGADAYAAVRSALQRAGRVVREQAGGAR